LRVGRENGSLSIKLGFFHFRGSLLNCMINHWLYDRLSLN